MATGEHRSPWEVIALSAITLGIWTIFYWYSLNRELSKLGHGTEPRRSQLALFPGVLVIVPAFLTLRATFLRVRQVQRERGVELLAGWLGVCLFVVAWPAYFGYLQSGLNTARQAA